MTIFLKVLKWVGIAVGVVVALLMVAVVALYFVVGARINKTYEVQVAAIPIPGGPEAVARGKHLIETVGLCQECHGENLGGQVLEEDPLSGRFAPSNLTAGKGGIGVTFKDIDYVRAIRHGLDPENKPLFVMPSEFYYKLSDADVGAIVVYLKSLPPVDNEMLPTQAGIFSRLLILMGAPFIPAEFIDHSGPRPSTPEPGVTGEYGEYMAVVCSLCHGENLVGGSVPGEGPEAPQAPNITPAGPIKEWSEADFVTALRTAVTPGGDELDNEYMPWKHFAKLTDDELMALWLYLKSIPPAEREG